MLYSFLVAFVFSNLLFVSQTTTIESNLVDRGLASWYRQFDCLCAASTKYPRGTKLRVTHARTGKFVDVRVNDYGPDPRQHADRIIDLDVTAFKLLSSPRHGVIPVEVALVPGSNNNHD